jgi:hypothetical protein
MDKHTHQKVFSNERLQKYVDFYAGDEEKALLLYQCNINLSESFYPLLSIFEVALRNSMNRELTKSYGTPDWYSHLSSTPGLKDLNREITLAIRHINKRGETVTGSKVVAELTLGFWVRLFNAEYERILWKDLRKSFPFMPKKERQRHKVSVPLNKIRNFRNRVYHNEPISWSLIALENIYDETVQVLKWLNEQLPEYANKTCRFQEVMQQARTKLHTTSS